MINVKKGAIALPIFLELNITSVENENTIFLFCLNKQHKKLSSAFSFVIGPNTVQYIVGYRFVAVLYNMCKYMLSSASLLEDICVLNHSSAATVVRWPRPVYGDRDIRELYSTHNNTEKLEFTRIEIIAKL